LFTVGTGETAELLPLSSSVIVTVTVNVSAGRSSEKLRLVENIPVAGSITNGITAPSLQAAELLNASVALPSAGSVNVPVTSTV
jgi:hypothetical protein